MKEQERNAVLNAAVDIIVQSGVDVCQLCEWYQYNREEQMNDKHDDPCAPHRKDGDVACREGIICRLRRNVLKSEGLSEQKTGFTIYKKDGSSETVYSNCFCISSIDDEESGTNYNLLCGRKVEVLGLVELMQNNQKRLLKMVILLLRKYLISTICTVTAFFLTMATVIRRVS